MGSPGLSGPVGLQSLPPYALLPLPCLTQLWSWSSQDTRVHTFPRDSRCPSSHSLSSLTVSTASTGVLGSH